MTPLLIIFGVLAAASILSVFYTHQLPSYETRINTIATYKHTEYYSYLAKLKPNTFYNRTILRPGEGPLYTAIVDYVNITSKYSFISSPPPKNATTNTNVEIEIESPDKWTRTLSEDEALDLLEFSGSQDFKITVNRTKIYEYVKRIDEEVGIRSTSYNINVKPLIHCNAIVAATQIDETFTPTLTISFITSGDIGNYISIEEIFQTKDGKITETSKIYLEWVEKQRKIAYASAAFTSILLAGSAILYIQRRPEAPPKKTIEKVIAPYKELITETTERPPETENTIKINTIEDLAKTAEILAKPILHTQEDQDHIFYVIDGNTKYLYTVQA
jgi:hypothetical protein